MTRVSRDAALAHALAAWFARAARDLPWRRASPPHPASAHASGRDPYLSLVSEFMLQQTQVARVLERFAPFVARFPDARALARAPEQDVLAAWAGLGYYRRARLLHAAARAIMENHDGRVPHERASLRELPGVGAYTAGAIASIVFGGRDPAVDGNVTRVLLRIEGRQIDQSPREREKWVWERAAALVAASDQPGVFNEALMELGATVCTPAAPRCDACPVATRCHALARGLVDKIPPPKPKAQQRDVFHASVIVNDARGRTLIEQRPPRGMWASLWQTPTIERDDRPANAHELIQELRLDHAEHAGEFIHITTHRLVRFEVWRGTLPTRARPVRGTWMTTPQIQALGISSAQQRVLDMAPSCPPPQRRSIAT